MLLAFALFEGAGVFCLGFLQQLMTRNARGDIVIDNMTVEKISCNVLDYSIIFANVYYMTL